MKKLIGMVLMAVLSLLAVAGVASACWSGGYQPQVPKSLLK